MIVITSYDDEDKKYENTSYDYDDLDMDTRCYAISVEEVDNES